MIQAVSEGRGEVGALPTLLRRLIIELGVYDVPVSGSALFCPKNLMTQNEAEFKRFVRLSRLDSKVTAALFLFDADDDCARDCVPQMRQWAQETAPDFPCAVVMARREYEAWFLASLPSLRGKYGIPYDAVYAGDPEQKRGAKEALQVFAPFYKPTMHQAAFSAQMDLGDAFRNSASFQKLTREVCRLLEAQSRVPAVPAQWLRAE